jgi:hypothetical protein
VRKEGAGVFLGTALGRIPVMVSELNVLLSRNRLGD